MQFCLIPEGLKGAYDIAVAQFPDPRKVYLVIINSKTLDPKPIFSRM